MAVKKDEKELTFEEYLERKKIDPEAFKKGEPARFEEFSNLFAQMHPKSFSMQKLFLINPIRRRFPLQEDQSAQTEKKEKPSGKGSASPVFKRPKKE